MSIWKKLTKPPQRFRWKACFLKTLPVVFSFKGRIILAWAFFQIWIFCLKVKTVVTQNFHFLWIPERVTALVFLLRSKLLPVLHLSTGRTPWWRVCDFWVLWHFGAEGSWWDEGHADRTRHCNRWWLLQNGFELEVSKRKYLLNLKKVRLF